MTSFRRTKREKLENFMINEYGIWKIGRVEAENFLDQTITDTIHHFIETCVPEKQDIELEHSYADEFNRGWNECRDAILAKIKEEFKV